MNRTDVLVDCFPKLSPQAHPEEEVTDFTTSNEVHLRSEHQIGLIRHDHKIRAEFMAAEQSVQSTSGTSPPKSSPSVTFI